LIQPQVTRGITLGLAAVTAAVSAAVAQFEPSLQANRSSQPAEVVLASDRLQVLPRLELQSSQGALAAAQATQLAQQPVASAPEVAARAPALVVKRTPAQQPPAQGQAASGAGSAQVAVPAPNVPPGSVQDIIVKAFTPFGPGAVQWGLRVARCESGYNPNAVNSAGPYYGLFQFLMSTFKNTPYGNQNILDPVANASAAAWKYGNYGQGAWGCK
jgi:Transglycosylase SLT domain